MQKVVLIPGDGIGPEISAAVLKILAAAGAQIDWVEAEAGMAAYEAQGNPLPQNTLDLIREHKVVLKGPLTTPVGSGFRSINVSLRQEFNLFSNIRPARTLPGNHAPFKDVDLVLFRENTQGLYSGIERWADEEQTRAESIALITKEASEAIIGAAFDYARKHNRKKVTLVHKANILKLGTGLFLKCGNTIAKDYPEIEFEDLIVDNMAMQMVMNPQRFDVVVTTNLFGDILSDLASGLVGGLGLTGSANIGEGFAMFEAVHGSAPDIAGQNKANPTALLFSSMMMLDYLGQKDVADRIGAAILKVLAEKSNCTADLGGCRSTSEYGEAVIAAL
ncbi:isocitrate/isopropylmalate dehydrogenase family protein [Acanthopleuribacter pedis]|uniref:Isocitrate/homoisocitrate dehydrogenase n=1 Tax=Acanthopleuribacter pedis TaxID=442870 RepID=A0A8J7Q3S4_9BACT|nr:isocitrate/isopropylmalate dehydrogenase family protein [Acanthopleuribacter pedis]MBO1320032.1 isocitrate/isopropylmalate dehydrogenase family protein [Acanthopleuribacter pedis]